MNLIEQAAEIVGGQVNLARAAGVTPQMVTNWINGVQVSLERCVDIERATSGRITCEQLRPDKADYWAYLRESMA